MHVTLRHGRHVALDSTDSRTVELQSAAHSLGFWLSAPRARLCSCSPVKMGERKVLNKCVCLALVSSPPPCAHTAAGTTRPTLTPASSCARRRSARERPSARCVRAVGTVAANVRSRAPAAVQVRMMLPMSIRCNTCGNYIYKGAQAQSCLRACGADADECPCRHQVQQSQGRRCGRGLPRDPGLSLLLQVSALQRRAGDEDRPPKQRLRGGGWRLAQLRALEGQGRAGAGRRLATPLRSEPLGSCAL